MDDIAAMFFSGFIAILVVVYLLYESGDKR